MKHLLYSLIDSTTNYWIINLISNLNFGTWVFLILKISIGNGYK